MVKKMIQTKKETIHALGIDIGIYTADFENEYISLTDIARYRSSDPRITIHSWLRNRDVVDFLGLWEALHNTDFKRSEFDTFKKDAGSNAFTFSIKKWTDEMGAVGIVSKSGRYGGGIFAHRYIIKDYRRLQLDENSHLSQTWNLNREISKLNYRIHTDAIKGKLILPQLTPMQKSFVYADEADLLNVALFGETAKDWRTENPGKKGNIRDYADIPHLLVLANLESYNAILIKEGMAQSERLVKLRETAECQLGTILSLDLQKPILVGNEKNGSSLEGNGVGL